MALFASHSRPIELEKGNPAPFKALNKSRLHKAIQVRMSAQSISLTSNISPWNVGLYYEELVLASC